MKQCPQCSRVYADDALNFCLDDGAWLTASSIDEPVTAILSGDPPSEARTAHKVAPTGPVEQDSSPPATREARPGRSAKLIVAASILAVAILVSFGVYKYSSGRSTTPTLSIDKAKFTRLTTTGKAIEAAISPDAKYVAYVNLDGSHTESDNDTTSSLWIKQVATGQNIRIVGPGTYVDRGLTFSPDSNYIYYRAARADGQGKLFRGSVLGGDPQMVADEPFSAVTFSPDGKRIAFIRNHKPVLGESYLIVSNTDGTDAKAVSTHSQGELYATPARPTAPAWSPDGDHLIAALGHPAGNITLIDVRLSDGREQIVGSQKWSYIDGISFSADGKSLFLTGREQTSAQTQIWQVDYPSGEAHRISNDLNDYRGMSLSQDGKSFVVTQTTREADLWLVRDGKSAEAKALTSGAGKSDGYWGISWTPDGKLVYSSNSNGKRDLWLLDPDGGTQKQLTTGTSQSFYPMVSPDGRFIYFVSDRDDRFGIWRMNVDGSDVKEIVTAGTTQFTCSPDGQSIVYMASDAKGIPSLWKVSVDGGQPQLLSNEFWEEHPTLSPDGKQISMQYWNMEIPPAIGLIALEGGQVNKVMNAPFRLQPIFRWKSTGDSISYIDARDGTGNIWAAPVNGGTPTKLTSFDKDSLFWFEWSRDGRSLALSRGTQTSDVVLITYDH